MSNLIIINYDKEICRTEKFRNKVKELREKGNVIVLYSAHTLFSIKPTFRKNTIEYDYLALAYGALIVDKNLETVNTYHLHPNVAKRINKDLQMFSTVLSVNLFDLESDEAIYSNTLIKMYAPIANTSEYADMLKYISHRYRNHVVCHTTDYHYLDIVSKSANLNSIAYHILKHLNKTKMPVFYVNHNPIFLIVSYDFSSKEEETLPTITIKEIDNIDELLVQTS